MLCAFSTVRVMGVTIRAPLGINFNIRFLYAHNDTGPHNLKRSTDWDVQRLIAMRKRRRLDEEADG
jgi:hypothetical protein